MEEKDKPIKERSNGLACSVRPELNEIHLIMSKSIATYTEERDNMSSDQFKLAVEILRLVQQKHAKDKRPLRACKRCRSFIGSPWGILGHKEPLEPKATGQYIDDLESELKDAGKTRGKFFALFSTNSEKGEASLYSSWICLAGQRDKDYFEIEFSDSIDRAGLKRIPHIIKSFQSIVSLN
jgi:hypothetical protein